MRSQTQIVRTTIVVVQILASAQSEVHMSIIGIDLAYGPCALGLGIKGDVACMPIDVLARNSALDIVAPTCGSFETELGSLGCLTIQGTVGIANKACSSVSFLGLTFNGI